MRLLLTNDDGARAEGMDWLKRALLAQGQCTCVAPDRPRSGSGHAITLDRPLRVTAVPCDLGCPTYECSGTPTDCVTLGINDLCGGRPDLIVSGINDGANMGEDITYSGTVSAAMEGTIRGIPSIAISVVTGKASGTIAEEPGTLPGYRDGVAYETAAQVIRALARFVLQHGLPPGTFLNVNVPNLPPNKVAGLRLTRLGFRDYEITTDRRVDPSGRAYYWIHGAPADTCYEDEMDIGCVAAGKVSITPVTLDFTARSALEMLRAEGLEEIFQRLAPA